MLTLAARPPDVDAEDGVATATGRTTGPETTSSTTTDRTARTRAVPCSPAQQRLWVVEQMEAGSPVLNIAVAWQLNGAVDAVLIERAFQAVVARHDALRTAIVDECGTLMQVVHAEAALHLDLVNLRHLAPDSATAQLAQLGAAEAHRVFDIERPPLLRVTLVALAAERSVLLVTMHHIVSDGWSVGVIARDFGRLYASLRAGEPALLEPVCSYADLIAPNRVLVDPDAIAFWRNSLRGLPYAGPRPDFARPSEQTSNGAIVSILLTRDITDPLAALGRTLGATFFMTALTALLVLLRRASGEDDLAVTTQIAGRESVEQEDVVGLFIRTLVLRVDTAGATSFAALLERVRDVVLDAFEYRDVPLETLIELGNRGRDLSRKSLCPVNFIFQRSFVAADRFGGLELVDQPSYATGSLYELNVFMVERPDGWRLACEYNTDLYRADTVRGLLETLNAVFGAVGADPHCDVRLLATPQLDGASGAVAASAMTAAEQTAARLLAIWRDTLERADIGAEDDFFAVGGHSLLAARLMARVAGAFGRRLPLSALFKAPSVAAFARLIDQPPPRATSHGATRARIFALNHVAPYYELSKLVASREIVPLQIFDAAAPAENFPRTCEEIAAAYVRLIEREDPRGPYVLMGWCNGGAVAVEAARQLRAEGKRVEMVIIIDCWLPGYARARGRLRAPLDEAAFRLKLIGRDVRRLLTGRMSGAAFIANRGFFKRRAAALGDFNSVLDRHMTGVLAGYEPAAIAAPVLLLRAAGEPRGWPLDHALGWRPFAPMGLRVRFVPGEHFSMFAEPGVARLAEAIDTAMARLPATP